ncbi:MAG TPA: ribonuclease P protein component [Mycoplasmatales bacterium]|jgi:ribonuclease P protein component|nr:ribonuclease P protein component [Mycoplasmatales bacterium]
MVNFSWKKNKLKNRQQFQKIIKNKKRVFNNFFIIFYKKKDDQKISSQHCNLGISIPQKLAKKSNVRNKLKRVVKFAILQISKENNFLTRILNKWNIVIIMKNDCINLKFSEKKMQIKIIMELAKKKILQRKIDNNGSN